MRTYAGSKYKSYPFKRMLHKKYRQYHIVSFMLVASYVYTMNVIAAPSPPSNPPRCLVGYREYNNLGHTLCDLDILAVPIGDEIA